MSAHVYAIQCRDGSLYIGHTEDLQQRWAQHLAGRVRWTRSRAPLSLVYTEQHEDRQMAVQRERALKTGCGREWLNAQVAGGRPACRQAGVITEIIK